MKITLILAILSITFCSCSHYYYVPDSRNVPLLKQKGDISINACSNVILYGGTGFAINSAYAFNNKNGILLNIQHYSDSDKDSANRISGGSGYIVETAIGQFYTGNDNWCSEGFIGLGYGLQEHQYRLQNSSGYYFPTTSQMNMTKLFGQYDFGIKFKLLEIALSARLTYLSFNSIQNKYLFTKDDSGKFILESEVEKFNYIRENPNIILIEPSAIIRASLIENVKGQFQMNWSYPLTAKQLSMENFSFSFGIQILLHNVKK